MDLIVGLLGILKAGAAYLPLDAAYPQDRLSSMLEDAQVSVLLTQQQLADNLPEYKGKLVLLDTNWTIIAQESTENLTNQVTCENLAYVIYTSGSTGKPKGVQIEHRGLLNLVFWHQEAFNISSADRATHVAEQYDWQGLSSVEQQEKLEIFLQTDRTQNFQLSKAPLIRLTLIRLSETVYEFICSFHHILLVLWQPKIAT
ncbi:amino acid adenylation domain-containing protein [Nostoc sp. NIES-4103]|nr:amino acid adenylation domain-containing protein [Nostoc sp. NIES-4103]